MVKLLKIDGGFIYVNENLIVSIEEIPCKNKPYFRLQTVLDKWVCVEDTPSLKKLISEE